MKTVSKKLLSLLLVVLLLAAAVPFQAFAEGTSYKVNVTVNSKADGSELASFDIDANTEEPVTKSGLDKAVDDNIKGLPAVQGKTYVISAYRTAPGSPVLADVNPALIPADGSAAVSIVVEVEINETTDDSDSVFTLELDALDGKISGTNIDKTTLTFTKKDNGKATISGLPTATKANNDFLGWFAGDKKLENGDEIDQNTTATARYKTITYVINVKAVKTTQNVENAWLISTYNATTGVNLLDFLKTEAAGDVESYNDSRITGYELVTKGGSIQWFLYTSNTPLTGQESVADASRDVFVKYAPKTFDLIFRPNGGTVSLDSKKVTFDSKVGTLPTPSKSGDVFVGWFDESTGEQYTSETVYKVNGDTTLTAHWKSEASVLLRIYLYPNTTTPDRIVDITGKFNGNSVPRSEVWNTILTKYYQGSNMSAVGLFTDATWESYKAGSLTDGSLNVTIQENSDKTTNIYVVVKNATNKPNSSTSSSSSSNSSSSTTKPADKDNPKTGDSMLIYAASAVMIVAAAALVTVQVLRKKRTY